VGWPCGRLALALPDMSADTRVYEIRVQGELAPRWSCWFAGLAVETSDGETVIVGPVDDQAALHGLLARIRDLGLPLLGLRVIDD
jgi:hypothetical protein